jgi:hypothetical protein
LELPTHFFKKTPSFQNGVVHLKVYSVKDGYRQSHDVFLTRLKPGSTFIVRLDLMMSPVFPVPISRKTGVRFRDFGCFIDMRRTITPF